MASAGPAAKVPHIIVLHDNGPDWRWVAHLMPEIDWEFVAVPRVEGRVRKRLNKFVRAWKAARLARDADLIVTFDEGLCAALEIARLAIPGGPPHATYYFNFDHLPQGFKRKRQAALFRRVSRFVVSSKAEQSIYADHFGIDRSRLDFILWGVKALVASERSSGPPDYVCAVGGNARDYALLMAVAAQRPAVRFVIVVRPANLEGLTVPDNVEILCNIPYADAMAVVRGARLMALPLLKTDAPCGHVTIVSAFYLGTPVVVTESTGIDDYVTDGETGLVSAHGEAAFGAAIDRLWSDDSERHRIAANAKAFAKTRCTEANYPPHVRALIGVSN